MRIPRLDRSQVDASTGEVFDQVERERGKVPNMFGTKRRLMSFVPESKGFYRSCTGDPILRRRASPMDLRPRHLRLGRLRADRGSGQAR